MYKEDMSFNNQQGLICHKTKPNQIEYFLIDSEIFLSWCGVSYSSLLSLSPHTHNHYDISNKRVYIFILLVLLTPFSPIVYKKEGHFIWQSVKEMENLKFKHVKLWKENCVLS